MADDNNNLLFFCSDTGHELCDELHLPSAESQAGGGEGGGVHPLRLPGLLRLEHIVSRGILSFISCLARSPPDKRHSLLHELFVKNTICLVALSALTAVL